MQASIIICTRNRAESLRSTLDSIGKVIVPQGWSAELLVVDNASTDHTPTVVDEARVKNPVLRYVREPKPGLSHARNTGLAATSGKVILFTDDDLCVPLNWLVVMCDPILRGTADAVAGGVVFPPDVAGALSRPPYSLRRSWFASTEELTADRPVRMIGANMAFHRRVLAKVPRFDVELGAGALGFNDETLFSMQLLAAGFKLIGVLDHPVEHHIDINRLTPQGMLEIARKMGRSHAFHFYHWEHKRSRLVIPRLVRCHLRRFGMRCFGWIKSENGENITERVLQSEEELAFYREYIVQRRRPFKYSLHGLVPQALEGKV